MKRQRVKIYYLLSLIISFFMLIFTTDYPQIYAEDGVLSGEDTHICEDETHNHSQESLEYDEENELITPQEDKSPFIEILDEETSTYAGATTPDFDIEMSLNPNPAIVGEDIIVSGLLKPRPFEAEIPPKEIVLVLDVSGSMKEKVKLNCEVVRYEKYCTKHNKVNCTNNGSHSWKTDYCVTHKTSGNHTYDSSSTKIQELKKAANLFIDKMKDIPNLKIGIVSYSTLATAHEKNLGTFWNPNYSALIPANNVTMLKNIIDNLNADGGTNTGEGMRKASWLLSSSSEQNQNANKTIVVMSDGIPTYYMTKNGKYSTDITQEDVRGAERQGKGSSDNDGKCIEYAETIGNIIKGQGYNAFTIGYGMNNEGNEKMRRIHEAMTGHDMSDKTINDSDRGFFADSTLAIDKVFEQIADKIIASYPVTNINFNFNSNNGFVLNIGGNTVSLPNVTYKKTEDLSGGKVKYEADPVPFNFIIKATLSGQHTVFENSTITFPWQGGEQQVDVPPVIIEIKDNELPNIEASLISETNPSILIGQNVDVRYEIRPQPFTYQDSSNQIVPKDVVIVLDKSLKSKQINDAGNYIGNSLWGSLLNYEELLNKNIRYGFITVGNQSEILSQLTNDTTYIDNNIIKKIQYEESEKPNFDSAFSLINDVFAASGRDEATKHVIFISAGSIQYSSTESIKNQNYQIISFALSPDNSATQDSKTLKELHQALNGQNDDYINNPNNDNNAIQNTLMKNVAKRLINVVTYRPYIFAPILEFNLNNNFEIVSGLTVINDQQVKLDLPQITYNYNAVTKQYEAENFEASFIVRPNDIGILKFGVLNTLNYLNMNGQDVKRNLLTPIVEVKPNNKITIQVSDSSGDINHLYNSNEELIQHTVQNDFRQEYNLYGDAFANIRLEGENLNHLKYQIIKSNTIPEFPSENYIDFKVGKDGEINGDIDYDNPGFLTQKAYNVSHMPSLSGDSQWKDRDKVFSNPFDETQIKPATIAKSGNDYAIRQEYIDENGNKAYRWVTNSVFLENTFVSNEFKEASKTWGYYKAPQSGYYTFRTSSDDGIKGILTVNESEFIFVDNWTPHGLQQNISKSVYLEEGQYYPIYIEYFNWGGSAAYKMEYSVSTKENVTSHNFVNIPADSFYPSKSKNPGEGGNNSFVGQSGVKFPEEIGKYYIVYLAGSSDENEMNFEETMRGIYGPFNVEDRFELSRTVLNQDPVKQGDTVKLQYIITPREIKVTDLYKTPEQLAGTLKTQLTVTDIKFKDLIPNQLIVENVLGGSAFPTYVTNTDVNQNTSLEGPINGDVTYTLKRDTQNLANSKYTAESIIIFVDVLAEKDGMVTFEDKKGALIYKDVTLEDDKQGAMKESYMGITSLEIEPASELIKYGFFNNNLGTNFIEEITGNAKVVKDVTYSFGMTMDIKASTSTFELNIPKQIKKANVVLDSNSVYLYELNEDNTINKSTKQKIPQMNINLTTNTIYSKLTDSIVTLEKGKKYLVTYSIKFTEDETLEHFPVKVTSVGKVDIYSRDINLEILLNNNELDLPDLL